MMIHDQFNRFVFLHTFQLSRDPVEPGWTLDGRAMPPMLIRALEENHVGFGR